MSKRSSEVGLALIPLAVELLLGVFLLPRSVPPDFVPLPVPDERALRAVERDDDLLAEEAHGAELPGEVRALGSRIREYHQLETLETPPAELHAAREALEKALADMLPTAGEGGLRRLRAVQLQQFMQEVARFEKTGEESAELLALAGGFVRSMRSEGWCTDHKLAMNRRELRVMFKAMWNAALLLESRSSLALGLDEQRALYAFYLTHPHVTDTTRFALSAARRNAKDRAACDAVEAGERVSADRWRLDRVNRYAPIDPEYP